MGTFVDFHWYPRLDRSRRDLFCLRVMQLHRGSPGFSCDQCTLLTFDPKPLLLDGHNDKQIYIVLFSISNLQMKISSPWRSPNEWGEQKDIQNTEWNNRGVVVRMAACSFFFFFFLPGLFFIFSLPARPWDWDGRCVPPALSEVWSKRINVQHKG